MIKESIHEAILNIYTHLTELKNSTFLLRLDLFPWDGKFLGNRARVIPQLSRKNFFSEWVLRCLMMFL